MNRDALLIYLKNLRDLEVAKWKIDNLYNEKESNYKRNDSYYRTKANYQTANYKTANKEMGCFLIIAVICLIITVIGIAVSYRLGQVVGNNVFFKVFGIAGIIIFILWIGALVKTLKSDKKKEYEVKQYNMQEEERVNRYNRQEKERLENCQVLLRKNQQQWKKESAFLSQEHTKVDNMLKKAYSVNILPNQYRNLASVYYIYDYMSSSQASLEDTLMHEHMENGIQRLESKLDTVISQNAQNIFQNRMIIERLDDIGSNMGTISNKIDEVNDSNIKILESCRRNESNTQQAAQYAAMAAQYAEADAYFGLANYLKN